MQSESCGIVSLSVCLSEGHEAAYKQYQQLQCNRPLKSKIAETTEFKSKTAVAFVSWPNLSNSSYHRVASVYNLSLLTSTLCSL